MIKKLVFCVLAIVVITAKSQVAATVVWVDNVGTDYSVYNISTALAANSNVYAAGRTNISPGNADIIVQCTDSSGTVLWTFPYDNGGYDSPEKIWVDASGNTYIAGISYDGATDRDFICIKLNSSGVQTWLKRYDGGINAKDEAFDIAVDGNSDVYVTGRCYGGSTYNSVTIKLDGSTGNLIWQNIFNPAGADCVGVTMVLANNQTDVIVGSNVDMGLGSTDIGVYQISASSGSGGWQTIVNGTGSADDVSSKIVLAGANVVLCGMVYNSSSGNDYTTIKMNGSTGAIIFQNDYNYSSNDKATSLVLDSAGNIAVTGYVYNSGASVFKYHTLCYDSTGAQMWVNQKDINCSSLNVEPSIVCDTIAHHFYVSGEIQKTSRDVLAYQITPSGLMGWEKTYDAIGSLDAATSLVVNGIGVVFVAANTSQSPGVFQITTLKISQTPVYFPPDLGSTEIKDPHFVFQENKGQLLHPNGTPVGSDTVAFYNQGSSPSYYFNASKISHLYYDRDTIPDSLVRVDLNVMGANPYAQMYRYEPVDALKHYFITSTQGVTDVRSYARLFVPDVLPNVDLHHYSNTSGLKSYFVFKTPGESISALRLKVDGANSTGVDASGNLIAYTDLGNINMGLLTAYQATYNPLTPTVPVLVPLTVSWLSLGSDLYRFNVSGYLPFWPVVVYVSKQGATSATAAPPTDNLYWSTFIGNQGNDMLIRNKVDAKDNYYTVGYTNSGNFPLATGGYQLPPGITSSALYGIVSKFDNQGALKFSSYVGGYNSSCGPVYNVVQDVAIDSLYQIYLVGQTTSTYMPTQTVPAFPSLNFLYNSSTVTVGSGCENAFIVKLNPTGNALKMGSYFGGETSERFICIKYWNGQIHMAGRSLSTGITLYTSPPNSYNLSSGQGVYIHIDTAGLVKHITKLENEINDLDMDNNGNAYLISSGSTSPAVQIRSPAGTFYTSSNSGQVDWVLQRFNQNDSLTWSTYIGGSSNESTNSIYIRDSVMVIGGSGGSSNFPCYKPNLSDSGEVAPVGTNDILMMKFNIKKGQRLWSAYHAGTSNQLTRAVVLDKNYNLYVAGTSNGTGSIRPVSKTTYFQQNTDIGYDGYLLGFTSDNQRLWTTYFGSQTLYGALNNTDFVLGMSVTKSDRLFICGHTKVKNNSMPLAQWNSVCYFDWQVADTLGGNSDGLIAMFEIPDLSQTVGIKEYTNAVKKDGFILYPNPNNGKFNIKLTKTPNEKLSVSVLNVMGQVVYNAENVKTENNEINVDLGHLSKGVYLMNLKNSQSSGSFKFIIE